MHQYQLQKYAGTQSRTRCPACQHRRKTFTRYINTQTNEPLASHVGICDRLDKCGYHFTPRQWFESEGLGLPGKALSIFKPKRGGVMVSLSNHGAQARTLSFDKLRMTAAHSNIPEKIFNGSLKQYHNNNLITYLTNTLGADATQMLIAKYRIGTAKHWPGATVFWQIDVNGKVRAGKVMLYNATSGKRVKQPYNHIIWAHTLLERHELLDRRCETKSKLNTDISILKSDFELQQCLFGEHLLDGNQQPVAVVESEKTALIASVLLPGMHWLASGGLSNLSAAKCQVFKGREVYFYPDLNAYQKWCGKAETLLPDIIITVSDLLELNADDDDRVDGLDIADYLLAGVI